MSVGRDVVQRGSNHRVAARNLVNEARSNPVVSTVAEIRIAELLAKEEALTAAIQVQWVHLKALRMISEAMGHPYKGANKTALDLAALAVEKLKAQGECTQLAHTLAYEATTSYIESECLWEDGWMDTGSWASACSARMKDPMRYLEMRGLIERQEGHPSLIQFRDESEAANGSL